MKKTRSTILFLAMLISILPLGIFADTDPTPLLPDGTYVIAYGPSTNSSSSHKISAMTAISEDDGYPEAIKIPLANGKPTVSEKHKGVVWTITNVGDYVTLQDYNGYYYYAEDGSSILYRSTNPTSGHLWKLSKDANGLYTLVNLEMNETLVYDKILTYFSLEANLSSTFLISTLTILPYCASHNYGQWRIDSDGSHYQSCTACGEEQHCTAKPTAKQDASGHWTQCETAGCGYSTSTTAHSYSSQWTITDPAGHYHTCTVAGCTYHDTLQPHALSWVTDASGHHQACSTCGYQTEPAPHTGSIWETTDSDHYHVCTDCSATYGKVAHSDADENHLCDICGYDLSCKHPAWSDTWTADPSGHYHSCTQCNAPQEVIPHAFSARKDEENHWQQCDICAFIRSSAAHTYSDGYQRSDTQHWYKCTGCDATTGTESHSYNTPAQDADSHWNQCICGARENVTAHSYTTRHSDADHHWMACACGKIAHQAPHTWKYESDETHHWEICQICGSSTASTKLPHTYTDGSCLCGRATPALPAPTLADGTYRILWDNKTFSALEENASHGFAPYGDAATHSNADIFTVTNTQDGRFTITDCYGRLISLSEKYDSFNVSTTAASGHEWTLEDAGNGAFYIKNAENGKYIVFDSIEDAWCGDDKQLPSGILTVTPATPTVPEPTETTAPTESSETTAPTESSSTTVPSTTQTATPQPPFIPAVPIPDGTYRITFGDLALSALDEDEQYGYPEAVHKSAAHIFTFTNTQDGKFTITDHHGRLLYLTGTYNSFNAGHGTEGHEWILEDAGNGAFFMKNVAKNKYITYDPIYETWGCYEQKQSSSILTLTPAAPTTTEPSETTTPTESSTAPSDTTQATTPEPPVIPVVPIPDGTCIITFGDLAMAALDADEKYGYPEGVHKASADPFTFTNTRDGKFTITDCYGRLLYLSGKYDSFDVSATATSGHEWVLEDAGNGAVYLKNAEKGKYVTYDPIYETWGCYSQKQASSVLYITAAIPDPMPTVPSEPQPSIPSEPEPTETTTPTVPSTATEPTTTEPVVTEPVVTEPTTIPVTTEPSTPESTTVPVTTEPATTVPVTTEPATTVPVTTVPVTTIAPPVPSTSAIPTVPDTTPAPDCTPPRAGDPICVAIVLLLASAIGILAIRKKR